MAEEPKPRQSARELMRQGLLAVRKRPEMYIGKHGSLNDLVFEAMCLSLAEAHCGSCSTITLRVDGSCFSIEDDGMGVSLVPDKWGRPFAQRAMTELLVCRDHDEHLRLKTDLCVMGLAAVNALSNTSSLVTSDGARSYTQTYTQGMPNEDFKQDQETRPRGTTLTFEADTSFLETSTFDEASLRKRINDLEVADLSGLTLNIET